MKKKLKTGQEIKVDDEDYIIEDVNEDNDFDEETGSGSKTREVIMSNRGQESNKIVKQNYKVNVNNNDRSIQMVKVTEKSEKFKNGFSYEKSSIFMRRSAQEGNHEDNDFDEETEDQNDVEEDW